MHAALCCKHSIDFFLTFVTSLNFHELKQGLNRVRTNKSDIQLCIDRTGAIFGSHIALSLGLLGPEQGSPILRPNLFLTLIAIEVTLQLTWRVLLLDLFICSRTLTRFARIIEFLGHPLAQSVANCVLLLAPSLEFLFFDGDILLVGGACTRQSLFRLCLLELFDIFIR